MATSRPPAAQIRLPLVTQLRTFSWPSLTSAFDPKEKSTVLEEAEHWLLTTLREKVVEIGAKVVAHGRYVTFQLAEVAVPRKLFQKIFSLIDDLRRRPAPT